LRNGCWLRAGEIEREPVATLLAMLEAAIRNGEPPDGDQLHG
jgi:hypothetical protein